MQEIILELVFRFNIWFDCLLTGEHYDKIRARAQAAKETKKYARYLYRGRRGKRSFRIGSIPVGGIVPGIIALYAWGIIIKNIFCMWFIPWYEPKKVDIPEPPKVDISEYVDYDVSYDY